MSSSLHVGRPFGISLYVHWTFWLLPLWVFYSHDPAGPVPLVMQMGLVFALFSCVVLHELGHALTARAFGIGTDSITLSPLGGMAKLQRMSWRPIEEFSIAIAGPLVNVAIASVLGAGLLIAMALQPDVLNTTAGTFVGLLLAMNVVMIVFNLLPAFPMDGGRIFRSTLAGVMGLLPATRVAVLVGSVVAVLFGLGGMLYFHNYLLPFIAIFVIFAGQQELLALERREAEGEELPTVTLAPQAPRWQPVIVYTWDPLHQVWIRQAHRPARPHGLA